MNVYVRELAGALAARGVTVDIFTRSAARADSIVRLGSGVRVVQIAAGPRAQVPKELLARHVPEFVHGVTAFATGDRTRYDLVHSHYWQSGLAAARLAARWAVPLVHTHHTLARMKNRFLALGDDPEPDERMRSEDEVLAAADLVTASSHAELAELRGRPAFLLSPGVDRTLFSPGDRHAARRELGLATERLVVAVGRIQRLKGLDLVVRALAYLAQPPSLAIAGGASGPGGQIELARLRRLAHALGLERRVRFLGRQPRARLPLLYHAADAAVVCSYSESFGLTALEAQACGVPVVGTRVGALPELVRHGESGFLVEARSPATFAERLRVLLADPELRAHFARVAVRSAAPYTWEQAAADLAARYDGLVRARRIKAVYA
jgi:D-inositol-3-phosphate glycosyltransferase